MYNSSLSPTQVFASAHSVQQEQLRYRKPLTSTFQQSLRLLLLAAACFFFAAPHVSAQEVRFAGSNGDKRVQAPATVLNAFEELGFNPTYAIIPPGVKVTVYSEKGFSGESTVFTGASRSHLPTTAPHDSSPGPVGIQSYKISKIDKSPAVKFTCPGFVYQYTQALSVGQYPKSVLLSSKGEACTEIYYQGLFRQNRWRRSLFYAFTGFTIPPNISVTLTADSGKTMTFPVSGKTDGTTHVDLQKIPDFYNKIKNIEVKNPAYRIKNVSLVEIESTPLSEEQMGHESKFTNQSYKATASHGAELSFTTEVSSTNEWSSSNAYGLTVGASVSSTTTVEVSGAPLGVGASASTSISIEASITSSLEKSFSNGQSHTSTKSYSATGLCEADCPPRSSCSFIAISKPVTKKYNATTTLVKWNSVTGQEVPGTEQEIESTMVLTLATDAICNSSDESLPADPSTLPNEEKFVELKNEFDFKKTLRFTATDAFVNQLYSGGVGVISNPEGQIFSDTYHSLLDAEQGKTMNALKIYGKYDEGLDGMRFLTVATQESIQEAEAAGYQHLSNMGFIYPPGSTVESTVPLTLYQKTKDGTKNYFTTSKPPQVGYEKVREEGHIIPKK